MLRYVNYVNYIYIIYIINSVFINYIKRKTYPREFAREFAILSISSNTLIIISQTYLHNGKGGREEQRAYFQNYYILFTCRAGSRAGFRTGFRVTTTISSCNRENASHFVLMCRQSGNFCVSQHVSRRIPICSRVRFALDSEII